MGVKDVWTQNVAIVFVSTVSVMFMIVGSLVEETPPRCDSLNDTLFENFTEVIRTEKVFTRTGNQTTDTEECLALHAADTRATDCPAYFDQISCWGPEKPGTRVFQRCPHHGQFEDIFRDVEEAYRLCGPDGRWYNRRLKPSAEGYSFYQCCFDPSDLQNADTIDKLSNETNAHRIEMAVTARLVQLVALVTSLVSVVLSLVIFGRFRVLHCDRTRIHRNLFAAMLASVVFDLLEVVDYKFAKGGSEEEHNTLSIHDTAGLCEFLFVVIEYFRLVKFTWMFVEGLYLHNLLAVSVFAIRPNFILYHIVGWGFPLVPVVCWAVQMAMFFKKKCWVGYYETNLLWVIQGPSTTIMLTNLFFLLNIIRVLVLKLQTSEHNETERVKKAVKAALVLLPLLGITNLMFLIEGDEQLNPVAYTAHMFILAILRGFEGFFLSLIYCFQNGEVRQALVRQWKRCRREVPHWRQSLRRMSRTLSSLMSFESGSSSGSTRSHHQSHHRPLNPVSKRGSDRSNTCSFRLTEVPVSEAERPTSEPGGVPVMTPIPEIAERQTEIPEVRPTESLITDNV